LVLNHTDDQLRVRASVGLPTHVANLAVPDDSISTYVYTTGKVVDSNNLTQSVEPTGHSQYVTEAFMCHPIAFGSTTFGVLNISDRNDGGEFEPADAALLGELARKLGLTFTLLPEEAFEPPPESQPAVLPTRPPSEDDEAPAIEETPGGAALPKPATEDVEGRAEPEEAEAEDAPVVPEPAEGAPLESAAGPASEPAQPTPAEDAGVPSTEAAADPTGDQPTRPVLEATTADAAGTAVDTAAGDEAPFAKPVGDAPVGGDVDGEPKDG
jgi:hypothetical protein